MVITRIGAITGRYNVGMHEEVNHKLWALFMSGKTEMKTKW